MALTDKLTAIADGFRASRGTEDKYTLDQMAVLAAEPIGGADLPEEAFTITGSCEYRFAYGNWDWFIEAYKHKLTTKDITNLQSTFTSTHCTELPFDVNVKGCYQFGSAFSGSHLTVSPRLTGTILVNTSLSFESMLQYCRYIRSFDDLFEEGMLDGISLLKVTGAFSSSRAPKFNSAESLRHSPAWVNKFNISEDSTAYPYPTYTVYNALYAGCSVLEDATNLPVLNCTATQSSNMFTDIFKNCYRLSTVTFETNTDGTAKPASWTSQVIDLSTAGFMKASYSLANPSSFLAGGCNSILGYNSGITRDKFVYTADTYAALKDDPDWFTAYDGVANSLPDPIYSRYNLASAIETINSLPDTSAAGGSNTIKFKRNAGTATDGGGITDESIAEAAVIASQKGWLVALV